ncbi:MAG TPA: hypothetical protein VGV87_23110 [Blastocatellia bacterium]|jgi:hypothetical protein|nr:hypothetical protein [Blastocatellia bacterium]
MFKKPLAMVLSGLLITTVLSAGTASANSKTERQARFTEKVRVNIAKLGTGNNALIALKLKDKTKVAGYISEVHADSFVVVHPKFGTVTSVNYADVAQAKGNNLSTGAKIAIGIGIGAAAVLIILLIYISCCTG